MKIIGHRGAAGHAPENTLVAVQKGLELGADGVEIDLHLSADGEPVVIHDATTRRTGSHEFEVRRVTWKQLQAVEVGAWFGHAFTGEPIPHLAQVLEAVPAGKILQLEIKGGDPGRWVEILNALVYGATPPACSPMVIAFDDALLGRIKQEIPAAVTFSLKSKPEDRMPVQTPHDGYGISRKLQPDPSWVKGLEEAGKQFGVWTVNEAPEKAVWQQSGAALLTSDFPDRFLAGD